MADVNVNTGTRVRWENAGVLRISHTAADYTVLRIEAGSLSYSRGGTEGISQMDRAQLQGEVIDGDERPGELSFSFSPTKNGLSGTPNMISVLEEAAASGLKTLVTIEVDIPDAIGGSTGVRASFTKAWLRDPVTYQAGGRGPNTDMMSATFQNESATEPTFADY
jgi:hypothetical protein